MGRRTDKTSEKNGISKTNVMRILDQKKAKYEAHSYESTGAISGNEVAAALGQDERQVFKTLVASGHRGQHYVFMVPVTGGLDLKKAAKAVGEKSVAMVHVSEINALTGYIRGGCSPIGMKKQYKTVFHSSILSQETVLVSAGKIGQQVELAPSDLIGLTRGSTANIVTEV